MDFLVFFSLSELVCLCVLCSVCRCVWTDPTGGVSIQSARGVGSWQCRTENVSISVTSDDVFSTLDGSIGGVSARFLWTRKHKQLERFHHQEPRAVCCENASDSVTLIMFFNILCLQIIIFFYYYFSLFFVFLHLLPTTGKYVHLAVMLTSQFCVVAMTLPQNAVLHK